MASICKALARCFQIGSQDAITECVQYPALEKHPLLCLSSHGFITAQDRQNAIDIVDIIFQSGNLQEKRIKRELEEVVGTQGWTESLAEAILDRLTTVVSAAEQDSNIGDFINGARDLALETFDWLKEHPEVATILATLAAIAVLYFVTPWVLVALGFSEEGVLAGKFTACPCPVGQD